MLNVGRALTMSTIAAALAVGVGSVAAASSGTPHLVTELATTGAQLVAEERELLVLARGGDGVSPADLAEARARLRTVDVEANGVLAQLDLLDVDVSNAIRTAMSLLPAPGSSSAGLDAPEPPPVVVYDAAVADLMRIAATPTASVGIGEQSDGGSSFGLLAVAAAALLALGLAALANTLRRSDDQDLAALAWSDGLTGVANRRRLDRDLATHPDGDEPTAVIMVDLDHFKQVNDTYGHQVGDDVLRRIGTLLAEHVRRDDIVYRYGGEEFCILLPGANQAEAQTIADRIVTAARSVLLPDGTHVTVSVGVADGAAADVAGTLETADRALYAAKSEGRNRTFSATAG